MTDFIELVATSKRFNYEYAKGYNDEDIDYIEKLYDINVSGQLRSFLSQIGRCAGNAIGDDQLFFYSQRSVRQQFNYQKSLNGRFRGYKKKYYFLGNAGYEYYVFLQTNTENPDQIYTFNVSRNNELQATEKTLFDYISDCLHKSQSKIPFSFEGSIIP